MSEEMNVLRAAELLINHPWSPKAIDEALPVVRANKEETARYFEEILRDAAGYHKNEEGPASPAYEGLLVFSAAVLLGEMKDPNAFEPILDYYAAQSEPYDDVAISAFKPVMREVLNATYNGNATKTKIMALDTDLPEDARALAAFSIGVAAKNGDIQKEEAADLLMDIADFSAEEMSDLTDNALQGALLAGIRPVVEEAAKHHPELLKTVQTVDFLLEMGPKFSSFITKDDVDYQDYTYLAMSMMDLTNLNGNPPVEPEQDAYEKFLEDMDEEMLDAMQLMQGMTPAQMTAFVQQNPHLATKMQSYFRKHMPAKNMLANKKASAPVNASLDEFKSKKKKKGGKKAVKKAAKGKKK